MSEVITWQLRGAEYQASANSVRALLVESIRNDREIRIQDILTLIPLSDAQTAIDQLETNREHLIFANRTVTNDTKPGGQVPLVLEFFDNQMGRFSVEIPSSISATTLIENWPDGEAVRLDMAASAVKFHFDDIPTEFDDLLGGQDFFISKLGLAAGNMNFDFISENDPQKILKVFVDLNRSGPSGATLLSIPVLARLGRRVRTLFVENPPDVHGGRMHCDGSTAH